MARAIHILLASAIGAAIGAGVMSAVIAIWRPDLGRIDVLTLILVVFGVVVTALTILAAFQVSGLWTDVETRTHRIERGLRENQRQVAKEVLDEDKLAQAEMQRAKEPKWWQLLLVLAGSIAVFYYFTERVLHVSDFEEMRNAWVAQRKTDQSQTT